MKNQNEQNSTDMISYSGGTQFNSELTPQYSKNSEIIKQENTETAPSFTENKYKNDLFKGESFLCSDNSMSFFDNQEKKVAIVLKIIVKIIVKIIYYQMHWLNIVIKKIYSMNLLNLWNIKIV